MGEKRAALRCTGPSGTNYVQTSEDFVGILDRNLVKLSYDVDALPTLHCPLTGRAIFRPTDGDEPKLIQYARNKAVLFSLLSPMVGDEELDYFRKDLKRAIKQLRKSLSDEELDSNFDLLDNHFSDWPGNIMVFELTLDGQHGECQYIGIDLGSQSVDEGGD